ncbi:hypothetical protein UlMin_015357 [Ulmus minor]
MSRRGGGRRPDFRRDQPSPVPSPSVQAGRGGARGRGRGRTGGTTPARSPAPPPAPANVAPQPAISTPSSSSSPAPAPSAASSSSSSPAPAPSAASSSSSSATLARELESKLKLPAPATVETAPPASSKAVRFTRRPSFGTVGRKCVVRANHFLVNVASRDLFHYDVSISPEVPSKKVNRDVIKMLVDRYGASHLGSRNPAYDGRKSLYSAGELPFSSKEFRVTLVENDGNAGTSSRRREREFNVTIKFASKPDLDHLQQFLRGRQPDIPQETIQLLDVVLRGKPTTEYTVVGRSFFSTNLGRKGELGDGIEYWKGFYQSLRPTQMGLSLNIDVSARGFYEPILVTDFVVKYLNLRDRSRPLSDMGRVKVKKALRGVKVHFSHNDHHRTCKIAGLSLEPMNNLMFTLDDDQTRVSVVQYFRDKYGIALKHVNWPALQAGSSTKPIYLPMELSMIVEGQRYTKKLNEKQVTNLLRATCQRPNEREESIKTMVRKNNYSGEGLVREFGIQVKSEMTLVNARVLPPPMLSYGQSATENPRMGQWNMIDKKMVNGGKVDFWAVVNFSRLDQNVVFQFCQALVGMCNKKGVAFAPQPLLPIKSANPSQIEKALRNIDMECQKIGKRLQLLIIVLPEEKGSYGPIKRICETELGIVSQCCQPRQAYSAKMQYLENVSLKINVKVGGRNTVLSAALQKRIPFVTDRPTIIFGADVTHPQPGEDSSPSIAAVVASMDWPEVTKYRALVSAQTHRVEIIQDMFKVEHDPQRGVVNGGMIREHLIAFYRSTGQKPDRIIFYRDGVSEGQFSQVLLYEVDAIRKACNSIQSDYTPRVTFIVVQKRHHTRLFPEDHGNRNSTDRSGNIQPGTVVDTQICHPSEFDFYLNSHAGIQGTSRPTHYHVLYDENAFTTDALQVLTNNLCYTYARCTRSVSIVPPAYYAHLAAFRARYYIEGEEESSSSGGRSTVRENRPLPVIKDNVKDVMFYC